MNVRQFIWKRFADCPCNSLPLTANRQFIAPPSSGRRFGSREDPENHHGLASLKSIFKVQ